ncbi:hypothetical protein SAMN04487894_11953 [Niabella drilacis]|uniref:Uncharacterized protein n=1 Tax=Niabella drilacis (strain DSM 25811 / CCM 8410 / CCUG 62505 / LMG 26954 / E90) TaxID=1285928 RepID=A0A1G6ZSX3_NIADE|nr:hypothetical protein SAMN04487894_11953 [Niabella drilacis]
MVIAGKAKMNSKNSGAGKGCRNSFEWLMILRRNHTLKAYHAFETG